MHAAGAAGRCACGQSMAWRRVSLQTADALHQHSSNLCTSPCAVSRRRLKQQRDPCAGCMWQAQRANALAAEQGLAQRVSFQVADALQQPFADASFDLVWSLESGEHMCATAVSCNTHRSVSNTCKAKSMSRCFAFLARHAEIVLNLLYSSMAAKQPTFAGPQNSLRVGLGSGWRRAF